MYFLATAYNDTQTLHWTHNNILYTYEVLAEDCKEVPGKYG